VTKVVQTLFFNFYYFIFQQFIFVYGGTNAYVSRAEAILIKRLVERETWRKWARFVLSSICTVNSNSDGKLKRQITRLGRLVRIELQSTSRSSTTFFLFKKEKVANLKELQRF
jgi:hypothetical protein